MKLTNLLSLNGFSLFLVFPVLFLSCKKDSGTSDVSATASHITAVYAQDDHYVHVDSLNYDSNGRIARIRQWTYDTTAGVTFPVLDSTDYTFVFSGNGTVPASFTMTSSYITGTESHILYYDSQNRIVKDSLVNLSDGNFVSANYRYGTNLLAFDVYKRNNNIVVKAETDSLFPAANGNIYNANLHYLDYNNQIAEEKYITTFSTYSNPFYNKAVAESVGMFLSGLLALDFISPNMFSTTSTTSSSGYSDMLSYTWTRDAKGRVVKGVEPSGQFGYAFHYNN